MYSGLIFVAWCGEVNIHKDIREKQVDPFRSCLDDERIEILSLSIGKKFEQPVSLPLLANIIGGGQGAAEDRGEILTHFLRKTRFLSSDYAV